MNANFKYLPFLSGTYSTAPGIRLTSNASSAEDHLIFQIDSQYRHYLQNKQECRRENIKKYYLTENLPVATIAAVNSFIFNQLLLEHPQQFRAASDTRLFNSLTKEQIAFDLERVTVESDTYLSAFDALCHQVQEDLAVVQMTPKSDYLAAVHLCAPNYWSAAEKIGNPFDVVHKPVADMEQTTAHYRNILDTIVGKRGPYTRFGWGIGTDNRLNHHPEPPPGVDPVTWRGRTLSDRDTPIFIRVERQNLVGFPEVNAFLFTIRTFFYNVDDLSAHEKQLLWQSVQSMSPATLKYKGLENWLTELKQRLYV